MSENAQREAPVEAVREKLVQLIAGDRAFVAVYTPEDRRMRVTYYGEEPPSEADRATRIGEARA